MQRALKPPSDEGGGFCEAKGGGRDKIFSPPVKNQRFLPAPSSEGAILCEFNLLFLYFLCNGAFSLVGASAHVAVNFGELTVFQNGADHATVIQTAAIAGQENFFLHLIPP